MLKKLLNAVVSKHILHQIERIIFQFFEHFSFLFRRSRLYMQLSGPQSINNIQVHIPPMPAECILNRVDHAPIHPSGPQGW